MQITLNGKEQAVKDGITLRELLDSLEIDFETVVVERDQIIYSSAEFEATRVHPGDVLEIVRFMGGG